MRRRRDTTSIPTRRCWIALCSHSSSSSMPSPLDDPYLQPFAAKLSRGADRVNQLRRRLTEDGGSLADIASGHEYFGLHREGAGWVFREWAPNADAISLVGTFSDWQERDGFALERSNENGEWEIRLPPGCVAAWRHVPPTPALARRRWRPCSRLCTQGRPG